MSCYSVPLGNTFQICMYRGNDDFGDKEYQLNTVGVNTKILAKTYAWLKLLFMEAHNVILCLTQD